MVKPPIKKAPRGRPSTGSKAHSADYVLLMERAQALELSSVTDWCRLILTNTLPALVPARPELLYADKFANDPGAAWRELLNLKRPPTQDELDLLPDVDQRGYVEFEYATEMAKTLELATVEDWYRRAGELHPSCPREPWSVYFRAGFTSLEEFVGLPPPPPVAPFK
jgi:hypothetical protein